MPEGVTVIRKDAFRFCEKLKYVHLPESLSRIGEGAFAGCTVLEDIVIPESVTKIEAMTFYDCRKLKTIKMPGVRSIGTNAFMGCMELRITKISDDEPLTEPDMINQKPDELAVEKKTEATPLKRVLYIRPSQLSADLLSGQISIGGEVYQFPMHYEDFAAYGLMMEANTEEILAPGEYRFVDVGDGENKFVIDVENIDNYNRPLKECYVTSITIHPNKIVNLEIVLPGGLKLQDCSKEEVEARYGKTQIIFDVEICTLTYATDYKTVVSFRFKKEDMSLTRVRLNTIAEANSNGT